MPETRRPRAASGSASGRCRSRARAPARHRRARRASPRRAPRRRGRTSSRCSRRTRLQRARRRSPRTHDPPAPADHLTGRRPASAAGEPGHTAGVNPHALEVLEFPAILERLAAAAATAPGAQTARELLPSPHPEDVARRQALTTEAVALLDNSAEPELAGVEDVREPAARAARDGRPRGRFAAAGRGRAARGRRGATSARGRREAAPLLARIAERIDPAVAPVADEIGRCVEEDGSDLRDTASPQLRRLRNELRNGRHRIAEELARIARSGDTADLLQERFVARARRAAGAAR